jgi:DNA-binding cell septation regulator SpoVG
VAIPDEEYEQNLYKPKSLQQTRRRQQSEETLLNEIFEGVADHCIKIDKTKLFVAPVKKKDAPNYLDIIRHPMDLTNIKSKAKRLEYRSRAAFEGDLLLIQANAEQYNSLEHPIAFEARRIVAEAIAKLNAVANDIANFELLVHEKIGQGLIK